MTDINSENISPREKENALLSRLAAVQGMVLLENNGILPLKEKRIALYGMGARYTIKGGTGSGEVNNRYNISIEAGLINSGLEVTTFAYLNSLDDTYREALEERKKEVARIRKRYSWFQVSNSLNAAFAIPFHMPSGREITMDDVSSSEAETALYVLSRQAGEGGDRKLVKGDYYLTDKEISDLVFLRENYKHLILIINSGSSLDLSIKERVKFDAVVFYGQAGQEGGNALGDLLTGKENFSGKLTASWPKDIKKLEISKDYSYLDGNVDEEFYRDGIYVGYRYYDAFDLTPLYPFGFGLTYTSFDYSGSFSLKGDEVTVSYNVKNTGKRSGQDVMQVYVSSPEGKIAKEIKSLEGFRKSSLLKPGEEEKGTVAFKVENLASYEEKEARYMLEKGQYYIYIGDSSSSLTYLGALVLKDSFMTEQCRNICPLKRGFNEIQPLVRRKAEEGGISIEVDPKELHKVLNDYMIPMPSQANMDKSKTMKRKDLACLLCGDPCMLKGQPFPVAGEVGQSSERLHKKYGMKRITMADGPAGLRLLKDYYTDRKGIPHYSPISEDMMLSNKLAEMLRHFQMKKKKGYSVSHAYATAFPVGIVLAQSFNPDLLEQIGVGVSQEMEEYGISCWLAPGMNIMRHPLCGRNFEYYSEDPFLTGVLAGHLARGVNKDKTKTVTFKHFCCNSQEENRMKSDAIIHERALREIYLRGFKIALGYHANYAVMTSYNLVNGVYTNSSHDLDTLFLRGECGFEGFVMTDWMSVSKGQAEAYKAISAGNDIIMPGSSSNIKDVIKALKVNDINERSYSLSAARLLDAMDMIGK